MASYQNFLFSAEPSEVFFPRVKAALKSFCEGLKRTTSLMADDRRARIEFYREEYYFYLTLVDESWVVEESREIAENHATRSESAVIRKCTYRIEFYGDDDVNMDYFNDYFGIMEELQKIPGIIIYDYPNGTFFGV